MSSPMHDSRSFAKPITGGFQPMRLLLVVLAALLLVSFASNWYAAQVSLPRYCQDPDLALQRLAAINSENGPDDDKSRRDYMVAAKLEFLVPRAADESIDAYLLRLRHRLKEQCHPEYKASQI